MDGFDLPQSFKDKMGKLLGDELSGFLDCYSKEHKAGLRVNTLKSRGNQKNKMDTERVLL